MKPFMSAPSSAERFIVCKEFLGIKPAATKVGLHKTNVILTVLYTVFISMYMSVHLHFEPSLMSNHV